MEHNKTQIAPGGSISVIAAFNEEGKIKPLRIRLSRTEGHIEANIDRVLTTKEKVICHTFDCLVTLDDRQSRILLYYYPSTNKWEIGVKVA